MPLLYVYIHVCDNIAILKFTKRFSSSFTLSGNWQSEIFSVIDKNQIPEFWGGTARENNEFADLFRVSLLGLLLSFMNCCPV